MPKAASQPRAERLFRAMADPTRLAILQLLRPGERCVCDLVDALRVPQPTASRHLAYLRRAGLVEARKQGQWSYYRLSDARGPLHRRLLDCLECCGGAACAPSVACSARLARPARNGRRCC